MSFCLMVLLLVISKFLFSTNWQMINSFKGTKSRAIGTKSLFFLFFGIPCKSVSILSSLLSNTADQHNSRYFISLVNFLGFF